MATDVKNIRKREKRKASSDKQPWIVRLVRAISLWADLLLLLKTMLP